MTVRIIMLLAVVAAVGVSACTEPSAPAEKPAPQPESSSSTEAQAQPTKSDRPDDSLPSARKLPVAEDYQAETAAAIVQANYRAELDALETELHAEAK